MMSASSYVLGICWMSRMRGVKARRTSVLRLSLKLRASTRAFADASPARSSLVLHMQFRCSKSCLTRTKVWPSSADFAERGGDLYMLPSHAASSMSAQVVATATASTPHPSQASMPPLEASSSRNTRRNNGGASARLLQAPSKALSTAPSLVRDSLKTSTLSSRKKGIASTTAVTASARALAFNSCAFIMRKTFNICFPRVRRARGLSSSANAKATVWSSSMARSSSHESTLVGCLELASW
mmetsp:Transcript_110230/g.322601  ORF Transcript_110230/g.322601 Transcript_110230/m.322601 type:complete len:241 (-) Transcript_110230:926-1648(-)